MPLKRRRKDCRVAKSFFLVFQLRSHLDTPRSVSLSSIERYSLTSHCFLAAFKTRKPPASTPHFSIPFLRSPSSSLDDSASLQLQDGQSHSCTIKGGHLELNPTFRTPFLVSLLSPLKPPLNLLTTTSDLDFDIITAKSNTSKIH